MNDAARTLETIINELDGYHCWPECSGIVTLGEWVICAAEGNQCYWNNAPSYRELIDSGCSELIDVDLDEVDLNDEIEECHCPREFIQAALAILEKEESEYAQDELERRVSHIMEQSHDYITINYPRDFSNEFNITFCEGEPNGDDTVIDDDECERILLRWLTDEHDTWYGDVCDEDGRSIDTFSGI